MSYVITEPEVLQGAAQDLAGIRTSLAEATATVSGPTTGIVAAAQDEVSIAVASLFGKVGRQFQVLNAKRRESMQSLKVCWARGATAYVSAEAANAGQVLSDTVAQMAGGGQGAAAGLSAQTLAAFNFFGILNVEIGTGGIEIIFSTPGIDLPAVNIPPVNLSAFDSAPDNHSAR